MSKEHGTASEGDDMSSHASGDSTHNANSMQNTLSQSAPKIAELFQTDISDVMLLPFAEARAFALREFDRYFLTAALERNSGNIARTARALGLHRQSLQKLMTRRGLKANRGEAGNSKRAADTVPSES